MNEAERDFWRREHREARGRMRVIGLVALILIAAAAWLILNLRS